ncbi:phospholipase/carboxylesterase [Halolactibacillus miurensis]|uniref:Phospholipase/carboxylesterase n=1 Tax=Halolactibacillus miurensis TaxID=306541 RepID=A0A1I6R451_9BACI|nr:alpha/beta hydrolase [Halolactibacillus miurensis]GEM03582.1 phospholipase/carboxylesterase [Halolactibacillus miurensis]SFS59485.1 phospholipase/carboxylesterase [Halolactibacillus miurensis]
MKHLFIEKDKQKPVFLLLHGTGGTERDLIPVAEHIDPDASILSVRGNVNENGMARYFKRLREGVFDEESLVSETETLHQFLNQAAKEYDFDRQKLVALGYSNGANIAGSLLMHYEHSLRKAMLLHPMVPRRGIAYPTQDKVKVFIGAGHNDPLVDKSETEELVGLFEGQGIDVSVTYTNHGHALSNEEIASAKAWYEQNVVHE